MTETDTQEGKRTPRLGSADATRRALSPFAVDPHDIRRGAAPGGLA